MADHTLQRILGRRITRLFGSMLLGLIATALGCSQSGVRSPRKLLDGLWSEAPSRTARTASIGDLSSIEPREHTIDDLLSFARLSEHRRQNDQAEKLYRTAIEREPQNPMPYHRLGVMRAKEGKFEEADELFLQALRITPSDADLISDIGYCYYLQNRLDEAGRVLERAFEMRPDDPAIGNNLAMVLGEQGRYDECFAMFHRVGSEEQAHANMAFIHAQHGNLDRAKANYSRALTLNQTLRPAAEAMVQLARYERFHAPSPAEGPTPRNEFSVTQTVSAWPRAEQVSPGHAVPLPMARIETVRPTSFEQGVVAGQAVRW
ncbi:MAG: tetratricopeptide repeat protein [Thermoguttaceae bacterium]